MAGEYEERATRVLGAGLKIDPTTITIAPSAEQGSGLGVSFYDITLAGYDMRTADPESYRVLQQAGAHITTEGGNTAIRIARGLLTQVVDGTEATLAAEQSRTTQRPYTAAEEQRLLDSMYINEQGFIAGRITIDTEDGPITKEIRSNYGTDTLWTDYRSLDAADKPTIAELSGLLTRTSRSEVRPQDAMIADAQAALGFAGRPWNDPGFLTALETIAATRDNQDIARSYADIGSGTSRLNFFHSIDHPDDFGTTRYAIDATDTLTAAFDTRARELFLEELRNTGRSELATSLEACAAQSPADIERCIAR
jgi:hypothetical protein